MKLSFAVILTIALFALTTASSKYVKLTKAQIAANSEFLEDIRIFGVGYVVQKGVYENAQSSLPGLNYNVTAVEKIERQSTNTATAFYRFTVILTEQQNYARVRAIFAIKYNHKNGDFSFISYKYTRLRTGESSEGWFSYVPIDVRPYNDGIIGELKPLKKRIQEVVAWAMKEKKLPDSTYTLKFVYSGLLNGGSQTKEFFAKVGNSRGEFFRLEFSFHIHPTEEPIIVYERVQPNLKWFKTRSL